MLGVGGVGGQIISGFIGGWDLITGLVFAVTLVVFKWGVETCSDGMGFG